MASEICDDPVGVVPSNSVTVAVKAVPGFRFDTSTEGPVKPVICGTPWSRATVKRGVATGVKSERFHEIRKPVTRGVALTTAEPPADATGATNTDATAATAAPDTIHIPRM